MKRSWVILFCLASASLCAADFTRYQVILDRMPFGVEAPPAPPPGQGPNDKPLPPADSFTKTLKMCAVTRHALTGRLQVGLVDTVTKKNYFLAVGDTEDGITVVDADYDGESALLRKGDQESRLAMSDVASMTAASVPSVGPGIAGFGPGGANPGGIGRPAFPPGLMAGRPPVMSGAGETPNRIAAGSGPTMGAPSRLPTPFAARNPGVSTAVPSALAITPGTTTAPASSTDRFTAERDAVMAARRARMGVTNTLSGDALQQHLQQYQMDLIRAGGTKGPPLPIQWTPEMDQQLVKEGVLPPLPPQ